MNTYVAMQVNPGTRRLYKMVSAKTGKPIWYIAEMLIVAEMKRLEAQEAKAKKRR